MTSCFVSFHPMKMFAAQCWASQPREVLENIIMLSCLVLFASQLFHFPSRQPHELVKGVSKIDLKSDPCDEHKKTTTKFPYRSLTNEIEVAQCK